MTDGKLADNGKISSFKAEKGCPLGQPFLPERGKKMKNYDVKSALPVILQVARDYEEKLKDRHFLIVYRKRAGTERGRFTMKALKLC